MIEGPLKENDAHVKEFRSLADQSSEKRPPEERYSGYVSREGDKYDIDFREAMAVVFPELLRYSALRGRMEITLLKALYINLGDEYADFSVGRFQMKPSFAEQIRGFILTPEGKRYRNLLGNNSPKKGSREYRASIISDMEDIRRQFNYLVIFIKACEKTHKQLPSEGAGRVSFIASAYNTGFRKSAEEINLMTERKFFTTHLSGPPYYSYSDISLFWYRKSEKNKMIFFLRLTFFGTF